MTGIFKLGDLVVAKADWINGRTPLLILADEGMVYKAMYISGDLDGMVRRVFKGTELYEKVGSVFKEKKDGEKKLTDKEIIQSLECCSKGCRDKSCFGSEMDGIETCTNLLTQNALSLINRQKAEIERLTERAERVAICEKDYLEWATGFLKTRFDIKDWFTNPEHQRTPCTYEFFASTLWAKIESAMKYLFDLDEQNKKLRRENAELQNQVDELKDENAQLSEYE